MARRWGLSCKEVLSCLGVLSDADSEHEDDIEAGLSWDESDSSPMNCQIPTVKYVQVNQIGKRSKMVTVVKLLEKTYMWGHVFFTMGSN